jgi:plasmid stabilization system protein ParE
VKSRTLVLRRTALQDIARHERHLRKLRGSDFARAWAEALIDWLEQQAALGAQLGTSHPRRPFGYRRQATILAEFTEDAMDVVRVRFAGEDWQA